MNKEIRIPSARELVKEALHKNKNVDVNTLHEQAFKLMIRHRKKYYSTKVDVFLSKMRLPFTLKKKLKSAMLKPVRVDGVTYSNFMEEASRRVSQVFQVVSGNIAELCAKRELENAGLKENANFVRKKEQTDFIIYFPNINTPKRKHRVEVKNVKLRERGMRGLAFDGDSLFGFFNEAREFTKTTIMQIEEHCKKSGGFCYMPPSTLRKLKYKGKHFRSNTRFGRDMASFAKKGEIEKLKR